MVPDGHCGFRAVAFHVYGDQYRWSCVRKALLQELQSRAAVYANMGMNCDDLAKRIRFYGPNGAPLEYWFSSHDCAILTANKFGRPVILLSENRPMQAVYLPMFSPFSEETAHQAISL